MQGYVAVTDSPPCDFVEELMESSRGKSHRQDAGSGRLVAEHRNPGSEQQDEIYRVRISLAAYASVVPYVHEGGGGQSVRGVILSR